MTKRITYILAIISISCFIASCADIPLGNKQIFDPDKAEVRRAEKLEASGRYQEAANIYWTIAETKESPQREALKIRAAEVVLHTETKSQAQQYLGAIDETTLNQDLLVRKRVAVAELALLNGQPQVALDAVPTKLAQSSEKYKPHAYAVRAKALSATGNLRESVQTRIALNPLLKTNNQKNKNNQLIWQSLLKSNIDEINSWASNNQNANVAAWLQLAAIQKQAHENLPSLENKLQQWRSRYPSNTVPRQIVDSISKDWGSLRIAPTKIALLLPMTGRYSKVADAIKSGISTAREFGEALNPPPQVVLYDTGDDPSVAASYHSRAINEGADFIIGPLQKEAVNLLAVQSQLTVPTLTLNYADDNLAGPQNLFQFGLLPEDEARQVAERAAGDNHQTALVLVPESQWGTRLLEAFTYRFTELGGTVLQAERYESRQADYSVPIKSLLQLNQSEQRRRSVQSVIKEEVQFEPRRRQDADFIFIAASPQQARQIRPQLSYHFASDLPVYATSHVFSGNENISADQDINGVLYCDIPWLLSNEPSMALLRDTLDIQATSSSSRLPRFAALGIDAYLIIPHLQRLAANDYDRYDGTTGKLSIVEQNRIYRELIWAKFEKGQPLTIEPLPTPTAPNSTNQALN